MILKIKVQLEFVIFIMCSVLLIVLIRDDYIASQLISVELSYFLMQNGAIAGCFLRYCILLHLCPPDSQTCTTYFLGRAENFSVEVVVQSD